MSDARTAEAVRKAAGPIEEIGATFMLHPETFAQSTEQGYPHPFAGYFAGRGGVLGDVDHEVVNTVFNVFEPGVVKMFWEQGRPVHGAAEGARLYSESASQWGRAHLAGATGLDQIVELGERVIEAAPTAGLPLFAGWKAMPRGGDEAAHAMQVIFTLRELRGSIHMAALVTSGLTPVESHLLNKGPEYAAFFGWPEPFPAVDHLRARKDAVEETTNQQMAEIVGKALSPEEAEELAELTASALKVVTG